MRVLLHLENSLKLMCPRRVFVHEGRILDLLFCRDLKNSIFGMFLSLL